MKKTIWKNLASAAAVLAGISLLVTACLDEIDLGPKGVEYKRMVILGKVVKGSPSRVSVFVTETFDFEDRQIPRAITGAQVVMMDDSGRSVSLDPGDPGIYQLENPDNDPGFHLEVGLSYYLKMTTQKGKQYISSPEPLLDVPEAAALEVGKITKLEPDAIGGYSPVDYLSFEVTTPLVVSGAAERARLRWEVEETYKLTDTPINGAEPKTCYLTVAQNASAVRIFNGTELFSDELPGYPVYETAPNYRFHEGYYLNLIQESLSSGAYEYWRQTQELLNRTGSMFESPVGKVQSNFRSLDDETEDVFGYFYATRQDTIRLYVRPEIAGSPPSLCPPSVPAGGRPCPIAVCCNCLDQANSSTAKPWYWIE